MLALVMAGGAIGAALRYAAGEFLLRQLGSAMPWGTLAVNLIGSFAAGFLLVWLEDRGPAAILWRGLLVVGLLGALTTYSALMVESLVYVRSGRTGHAVLYLCVTLAAGFLLVWSGARLAEALRVG